MYNTKAPVLFQSVTAAKTDKQSDALTEFPQPVLQCSFVTIFDPFSPLFFDLLFMKVNIL